VPSSENALVVTSVDKQYPDVLGTRVKSPAKLEPPLFSATGDQCPAPPEPRFFQPIPGLDIANGRTFEIDLFLFIYARFRTDVDVFGYTLTVLALRPTALVNAGSIIAYGRCITSYPSLYAFILFVPLKDKAVEVEL
jgi:hypothetical protein